MLISPGTTVSTLTKDQCEEAQTLANQLLRRAGQESDHREWAARFWLAARIRQHLREHRVTGEHDQILADLMASAEPLLTPR